MQEATSSSVEVDEHAVTRCMLSEKRSHQRAIDRLLKGAGSSFATTAASNAHFAPGSSSVHPGYEELVTARANWLLLGLRRNVTGIG